MISTARTPVEAYILTLAFSVMFNSTTVYPASTSSRVYPTLINALSNISSSAFWNTTSTSTARNWSTNVKESTSSGSKNVNTTTASTVLNSTTNAGPNITTSKTLNASSVLTSYQTSTGSKTSSSTSTARNWSINVNQTTSPTSKIVNSTPASAVLSLTTNADPNITTSKTLNVSSVSTSYATSAGSKTPSSITVKPVPPLIRVIEKPSQTDVHNKIDVNDVGVPTWLLWTICTVIGLLGLLILCCVLYICLKMCGCIWEPLWGTNSRVYPYPGRQSFCMCCRQESVGNDIAKRNHRSRPRGKNTKLTFSETSRSRETTRQAAFRKGNGSPEPTPKLVVKVRKKQRARSISDWLPHSNNIRNINTSTK